VSSEPVANSQPTPPAGGERLLRRVENLLNLVALLVLGLLPIIEIFVRSVFRAGIPSASEYVEHFVLLVGYLGAMLAAREGEHLSVAAASLVRGERAKHIIQIVTGAVAVAFTTAFLIASTEWLITAFGSGLMVGILPIRFFAGVVPVSFAFITVRFILTMPRGRASAISGAVGVLVGILLALGSVTNLIYTVSMEIPEVVFTIESVWFGFIDLFSLPLIILLIVGAFLGTPLFVVLTGVAYLLFSRSAGIVAVVPNEGYTMLTSSSIPAIPMFTFVGYLLSESKAGERLFRLFRALFGWFRGGMVVASIIVSVFFATFTGASGVVILALGGLLYMILHERGRQSEPFTVGLLTGVGDLGLLFPPSLVLILYATTAQVNVLEMFLGGILPGTLTVIAFATIGIIVSIRRGDTTEPFSVRTLLHALGESIWEILLPAVIIVGFFSGLTTLVETGAVAVAYVVVVEVLVKREVSLKALMRAAVKSATIMGGVLVILAGARALSYYIVDSRIPMLLVEWVQTHIDSRIVFLLLLNLVLLVTGCLMDIFSAILVIAPLIIPLGDLFGIHPVHLGVIFVANMALGFITPPVGLELFLSSYRFNKPLVKVYRYVLPFFFLHLAVVLLITYVPWFTTVLVGG
jgi:C4-dicarboxylate transporter, DctM subunit